jgi:hypothetical protein
MLWGFQLGQAHMTPWFVAIEPFGPDDGEKWTRYVEWSGLTQLEEVISLDAKLCPYVLGEIKDEYWPHIVKEDFVLSFFTDLDFLKAQTSYVSRMHILCVVRNPDEHPSLSIAPNDFGFVGYDLMDTPWVSTSALSNCQGFPKAFDSSELSRSGLITDHKRAMEMQSGLRRAYPGEPHANCDVWAIFVSR